MKREKIYGGFLCFVFVDFFVFSQEKNPPLSFSADGEEVLLDSAGNLQAQYEGGISAGFVCSLRQK